MMKLVIVVEVVVFRARSSGVKEAVVMGAPWRW